MKQLIIIGLLLFAIMSCAMPVMPVMPEATFEEAIDHIVDQYGEPDKVVDSWFNDDGTVRTRIVWWEINEAYEVERPDGAGGTFTVTDYHTAYRAEVRNIPGDGWVVVDEWKGDIIFDV